MLIRGFYHPVLLLFHPNLKLNFAFKIAASSGRSILNWYVRAWSECFSPVTSIGRFRNASSGSASAAISARSEALKSACVRGIRLKSSPVDFSVRPPSWCLSVWSYWSPRDPSIRPIGNRFCVCEPSLPLSHCLFERV